MANFPCSEAVKTGWPQLSARREYLGPLPQTCQCTHRHAALHQSRTTSKSTHAAVCAEFLQALPRLPEGKGSLNTTKERGNHEYLLSPLADADSPASFLMRFQPWLQATFASLGKEKVEDDQEVAVASDELVGSGKGGKDEKVKRGRDGEGREGSGGTTQNRKCRRMLVSRELEMGGAPNAQEEKGSREAGRRGSAWAVSADFGDLSGKCKTAHLLQLEKCGTARALEPVRAERSSNLSECESAPAPQPENFNGSSSECEVDFQEEHLRSFSERLRARPTRACIKDVKRLPHRHQYIGRGASHLGCGRSLWANPFQVKRFGRVGAISKYEAMLKSTPSLERQLGQLNDKVLLCHCEASEPCHRDVLIKAWEDKFLTRGTREKYEEAAGAEELLRAAGLRETVEEPESQSEDEPGQASRGSGWRGLGSPMKIGRGTKAREIHDGAGLCSPGRWTPEQRRLPENDVLTELRNLLKQFVVGHLETNLFAKLACSKITECPFDGIEQLRERVYQLFERQGEDPRKKEEDKSSPLEFRLLGAFLRHTGDPERDLPSFAPGVRVGVGVRMPRVPAVHPRKRRWRLREQENPDAHLMYWGQGADNDNYASAKEFLETVEEQLEQCTQRASAEAN